jgi:hypothetical protein
MALGQTLLQSPSGRLPELTERNPYRLQGRRFILAFRARQTAPEDNVAALSMATPNAFTAS